MKHAIQAVTGSIYTAPDASVVIDESGTGGGVAAKVYTIRDLPPEEKPREKLLKYGPAFLSIQELFVVMLGNGTKKENILAMSHRLIKEYGEKSIADQKDPKKLAKALAIPIFRAMQIVVSLEIGRRFFKQAPGQVPFLRTPDQVYSYLKDMAALPKEHLRGLYLNAHYQLLHDEVISIGSLTANIIHPREVFRPAIEYGSTAFILAHNHPSGNPIPSDADRAITKQLVEAGKLIGITLLDHLIITKRKFVSIQEDYQ
jgi:DNA repair protein RadC